jgi:hypothetical protein
MSKFLDEIIEQYKKEINVNKNNNIELEIRFKKVKFSMFTIIYDYLLNNTDKTKAFITQSVAIMKVKNGSNQLQSNNIRSTYFKDRKTQETKFSSKTPLIIPYHDELFNVSLSIEKFNTPQFIADETVFVRFKNRASFFINNDDIEWRVDMTIANEINGSSIVSSLNKIIDQMFKTHDITVENMCNVFNEEKSSQKIYKYEIELELMNKENIKITSADIINVSKRILFISNPDYETEIIMENKTHEIASYIFNSAVALQSYNNKHGLKQLLPKVILLTRHEYKYIYPITGYYITEKADGIRAIGMTTTDGSYIISNKVIKTDYKSDVVSMVDGELINDVLYAFDVLVYKSKNVTNESFEHRLTYLSDAVNHINTSGLKIKAKEYILITDIEKDIKKIYDKQYSYEIDGIIIVKPGNNYKKTESYKWKDLCNNTIDFLVKKTPTSQLGLHPFIPKKNYTMYFLFVGISSEMYESLNLHTCPGYNEIFHDHNMGTYFPIQFTSSNAPYAYIYYHPNDSELNIDNNVVEFKCVENCIALDSPYIGWQIVRIRDDRKKDLESKKYYGNDYKIAEITWLNYMDPFPMEQLWLNNNSDEYFISNKSNMYHAQTSVISFMKDERIMSYSHSNKILDIGAGKGQDLGRYFAAKIKNLVAIDNDKASLSELIRRKFNHISTKKNKFASISTNIRRGTEPYWRSICARQLLQPYHGRRWKLHNQH